MSKEPFIARPAVTIHTYDAEGDAWERGIYLHLGETRIRVAETLAGFREFISWLRDIERDIGNNYFLTETDDE